VWDDGVPPAPLSTMVPRDASTILDVKGNHVVFQDGPRTVAMTPLRVENLSKPGTPPCYHGGSLLPKGLNRSTRVLTWTLFAREGKWGRRSLSHEEVLKARDYGSADITRLHGFGLKHEFYEALVAGKCLTEGYKALMNGGGANYKDSGLLDGGSGRGHRARQNE
jgi:hypothetical protein